MLYEVITLENAVETLANGIITQIDLGQMNDKMFVNHASVGLYPYIVTKSYNFV